MSNVAVIPQASAPLALALVPRSMGEAMDLANMMAKGKLVPAHLQNSPADCLMVVEQAMRWNVSPFAVAQCTSVVQGKLMYEGKLVAGVVNSSPKMTGSLSYAYSGAGDDRTVTVTGTLARETEARDVVVRLKDAKTNNRMWQVQPDQQLAYHGARVWSRRHMPEVMLGIYSPEEFPEDRAAPAEPRSVPNLARDPEPAPAGSMREAAADVLAEPRFPVIAPNGTLAAIREPKWLEAIGRALGGLESAEALSLWRAEMGVHLASMAEAGHHEMVEAAERLMDQRRDALMGAVA